MTCLAPIACYIRVHMQRCMQYKFKSPHHLSFSTLFKGQSSKSLLRLRQSLTVAPCVSRLKTRSQNYNNHNKSKNVTFGNATPFRFAYSLMGWFHAWSVYLSLAVIPQFWYLQILMSLTQNQASPSQPHTMVSLGLHEEKPWHMPRLREFP